MVGDNDIDTNLSVATHYENNSVNDRIFFNSSISVDVICVSGLILVILVAVLLFLRLSKKIRQLEREFVIVLRLLRRKTDLTAESLCLKD